MFCRIQIIKVVTPLATRLTQQSFYLSCYRGYITDILAPKRLLVQRSYQHKNISSNIDWSDDKFKKIIQDNKLVVFMKGTPDAPLCGFSKYVIQILKMHGCEDFKTLNVLADEKLRNRVKEFSNWPTIPQVYINGEFIGGFDILLQLHQSGELINELDKIGHRSALIDADPKSH